MVKLVHVIDMVKYNTDLIQLSAFELNLTFGVNCILNRLFIQDSLK